MSTADRESRKAPSSCLLAAIAGALLSGCAATQSPPLPEFESPPSFLNADATGDGEPRIHTAWAQHFDSEGLSELLLSAQSNNHSVSAAFHALQSSRAIVRQSRSELWPEIDGSASARRLSESATLSPNGVSDDIDRYDASLSAAWEIDLFGRIRKSVRADQANAAAQAALYEDIMLAVQADVVQSYFQINSFQSEIEILERSRETRRQSLELVEKRFDAGTVSELDVAQSQTLFAIAEARLFDLQRIQNSLIYGLAVLLGETPATFAFEPQPIEFAYEPTPAGLPSQLLARRPDVRQAEQRLAVASEEVGIAKVDFLPRISLSGAIGYAAYNWDALFKPASAFEELGAQGGASFFQAGGRRARLAQRQATFEQRLDEYKQIAIEAIAEVDDLLQSNRLLDARSKALQDAVGGARRAREISAVQYEKGVVDFIAFLDAERTALDIEQQFAQAQRTQIVNTVNLMRALGGPWLPAETDRSHAQ